jgi:hypothetical protein
LVVVEAWPVIAPFSDVVFVPVLLLPLLVDGTGYPPPEAVVLLEVGYIAWLDDVAELEPDHTVVGTLVEGANVYGEEVDVTLDISVVLVEVSL